LGSWPATEKAVRDETPLSDFVHLYLEPVSDKPNIWEKRIELDRQIQKTLTGYRGAK
jgi:hypothetical protein